MKFKTYQLILGILFFAQILYAQNMNYQTFPVYDENGILLKNPFTGGNITSIFSEVDLNNDGLNDLFVFDPYGNVNATYLNIDNSYKYAPSYIALFPDFKDWVLLRDYDNDGIMDAFSHDKDDLGIDFIKVHKGYYEDDMLHFELVTFYNNYDELVFFDGDGYENIIQIEATILPAINDLDGDGDLDIISSKATGGYLKSYINMSVENGWGTDSLHFVRTTSCYGGALESGNDILMELSPTAGECAMMRLSSNESLLHNGYSFLALDNDGDGVQDLLRGDGNSYKMNMLTNGGTPELAHFVAQDTAFPSYDLPIEVMLLPIASYVDADLDGEKDLLISAKVSNIAMDGYSHFYKNNGTTDHPTFEFQEEDWQVKNTICYGKFSHPTFTDYNQDGLMDMVVASQTIRYNSEQMAASLILFENTGTSTAPEFTLVDMDWLELSQFDSYWLRPNFGDLDGDGDKDLLVGDVDGKLIYLNNNAGENNPYDFDNPIYEYMGIDVSSSISPQILDMDNDGLNDIVVGVKQGYMVLFKNIGTNEIPSFDADANSASNIFQLGGISLGLDETIIPFFTKINDELILYAGTQNSGILEYQNITNNLDGNFNLINNNWNNINIGQYASPSFIDINKDGYLDVFIGNYRGGINTLSTDIYVGDEIVNVNNFQNLFDINIYPNPVSNELFIETNHSFNNANIEIYNVLGINIYQEKNVFIDKLFSMNTSSFSRGIYFIKVFSADHNSYLIESFIKE